MSANFQMALRRSNGNLHIRPKGNFDGSSAWELINLLYEQYDGKGRVFIDTHNLGYICPFGCSTFQGGVRQSGVPANMLYFKGEDGFKIAPDGARVIIMNSRYNKRNCDGNCTDCKCPKKKHHKQKNT